MQLIPLLAFVVGLGLIFWTLRSVIRTFVLPRSANDRLTRAVFLSTRRLFNIFTERATSYAERDRLMAEIEALRNQVVGIERSISLLESDASHEAGTGGKRTNVEHDGSWVSSGVAGFLAL